MYCSVLSKRPWALAAQVTKIKHENFITRQIYGSYIVSAESIRSQAAYLNRSPTTMLVYHYAIVCLYIAYLFDAGVALRDELRQYQDDLRRNQDDLCFNLSDLQKSIRTIMEKIEHRLDDHHAAQMELFQHNRQLQRKQDQLALKQDQLFKLLSGKRSMGSPPHMPVIFPSPSPRPSPGFSRRSSLSPAVGKIPRVRAHHGCEVNCQGVPHRRFVLCQGQPDSGESCIMLQS